MPGSLVAPGATATAVSAPAKPVPGPHPFLGAASLSEGPALAWAPSAAASGARPLGPPGSCASEAGV